ncbi:MAG: DUF116 domain-containing protein [Candidatus Korarchaeota archaeon]|nr:DUF116 domain-containing protein [Candidatus Korarchaeota archaeon]NIU84937.1 DUF116 domain-containing protein [Candidatus Thorarchaeota archaeon]NIW14954.1 DUF116 domain-containing protein [Candidatus Thorarchaeota archaeon]NIW52921.1 DUF116 domain-containing protein [Candidatus Korarchaeota archaeon]
MGYNFNYDLTPVSPSFLRKVLDLKGTLPKVTKIIRKFSIVNLSKLAVSNIVQVLEDMIKIYYHNTEVEADFSQIPPQQKALFLPHCSRKYMDSRCKAEFDPETSSYFCNHCSNDCLINRTTNMAERMGYDVYVLPGGSSVQKILEKKRYKAVVGVACPMEAKMGLEALQQFNIPAKGLPLLKNGCANTVFNYSLLKELLN